VVKSAPFLAYKCPRIDAQTPKDVRPLTSSINAPESDRSPGGL